ncbi:MAG: hypothetical protein K2M05_00785, partial [Paramuribaculum sp.]|nr:hypothetical protein [Paramuribaculum sp.]
PYYCKINAAYKISNFKLPRFVMGGTYNSHQKADCNTQQHGENGYPDRRPQTPCYVLPPVVLYEIKVEFVSKILYPISHFHILSVKGFTL